MHIAYPGDGTPASRPTWDEYWLAMAEMVPSRSLCDGAHVGAVIVDMDNEIVSTGWNGPPRGYDHGGRTCITWCARVQKDPTDRDPGYTDCPSLHAEANALMMSDKNKRRGGTIYVTSHVCFTCAKLIANSGLLRVVVNPDGDTPWRSPNTGYVFLETCGVDVDIMTSGVVVDITTGGVL